MLNKDTIFRSHDHGRLQIWSLDHTFTGGNGQTFSYLDLIALKNDILDFKDVEPERVLMEMIYRDYTHILTQNQVNYLEMSDEEREERYSKQARYKYRKLIQDSLMKHYFGTPVKYSRSLNTYVAVIKYAELLLLARGDSKTFTELVVSLIDNFYIDILMYECLPLLMTQEIIECSKNKGQILREFTISTICEYAEDHIEEYSKKIYK